MEINFTNILRLIARTAGQVTTLPVVDGKCWTVESLRRYPAAKICCDGKLIMFLKYGHRDGDPSVTIRPARRLKRSIFRLASPGSRETFTGDGVPVDDLTRYLPMDPQIFRSFARALNAYELPEISEDRMMPTERSSS